MNLWTTKRKISFYVHAVFVAIPFSISTVSAILFWRSLFGSWLLSVPMVLVVEILALAGLVLYVAHIPSPFHALRHLLPFISIVPLCYELYILLAHNGTVVAGATTGIIAAILVAVAHQCFRTIENLFIDPVQAAQERATERVAHMEHELTELQKRQQLVVRFFAEYTQQQPQFPVLPTVVDVQQPQPQLPEHRVDTPVALQEARSATEVSGVASEQDVSQHTPQRTEDQFKPLYNGASQPSVSTSISRMVADYKKQGLNVPRILEKHPDWNRSTVASAFSRS